MMLKMSLSSITSAASSVLIMASSATSYDTAGLLFDAASWLAYVYFTEIFYSSSAIFIMMESYVPTLGAMTLKIDLSSTSVNIATNSVIC